MHFWKNNNFNMALKIWSVWKWSDKESNLIHLTEMGQNILKTKR